MKDSKTCIGEKVDQDLENLLFRTRGAKLYEVHLSSEQPKRPMRHHRALVCHEEMH